MEAPTNLALYQGLLYQLDRFGAPTFEVAEFNYWWNFGTRKYTNKTLEVYDMTQKVTDALRVLTTPGEETLNADDTTDVRDFALPDDYYRLMNCIVTYVFKEDRECFKEGDRVSYPAQRMTADLEAFALKNTYHKPQYDRPYHKTINDRLYIMFDTPDIPDTGLYIEKVKFEYIKGPNVVKLEPDFTTILDENKCEFPEEITDEITKVVLKLVLERQGDAQRLQTNTSLDMN